ncbi:MAG: hypothetical protein KC912_16880 [Proteobacteria bacterium]|nr:hypothetical protein [Pseudomonadota bacterium]
MIGVTKPLSDALAIDQIALAEVRLLREAQSGDDGALRTLLEPHVDSVWSICTALMNETDALATVGSFQEHLRSDVIGFVLDQSFALQLYQGLWSTLAHRLGSQSPSDADSDAHRTLQALPHVVGLTYTFDAVVGLPISHLAALAGHTPVEAEGHRSAASTALAQWEPGLRRTLSVAAPEGLLDLVKAPIPRVPRPRPKRVWIALIVLALFVPTALIVGVAFWATPSASYTDTHELVSSPGAWFDPSDTAQLEAAYADNDVPRTLWETPSLMHIGLRDVGVVLLPDAGTAIIYEDERANLYTLQRWQGAVAPTYSGRATVGGVPLSFGQEGDVSIVAYAINGTVHVTTSTRPVEDLVSLVRRRLSHRG